MIKNQYHNKISKVINLILSYLMEQFNGKVTIFSPSCHSKPVGLCCYFMLHIKNFEEIYKIANGENCQWNICSSLNATVSHGLKYLK